ncbi:MAG: response regulator transcription factor [Nitrospira sp.]|nr:response regulator transcription factor [Nitrospira sp.]
MKKRILVIEDNKELAQLLELHLKDLSFSVDIALDGIAGIAKAEAHSYDLIILDLMLPGLDGLEICKRLRSKPSYVPILMLTSKSSELDRVLGLEIGADDYVTKPFSIIELMARVKAIFRRIEKINQKDDDEKYDIIHAGSMTIDTEKRRVTINGKTIEVTSKEFDLLLHFARNPERVFTRSQLLDKVWGYGHEGYEHTVNSHINRLRSKIEENPAKPRFILTVWSVGYKFGDFKKLVDHG